MITFAKSVVNFAQSGFFYHSFRTIFPAQINRAMVDLKLSEKLYNGLYHSIEVKFEATLRSFFPSIDQIFFIVPTIENGEELCIRVFFFFPCKIRIAQSII